MGETAVMEAATVHHSAVMELNVIDCGISFLQISSSQKIFNFREEGADYLLFGITLEAVGTPLLRGAWGSVMYAQSRGDNRLSQTVQKGYLMVPSSGMDFTKECCFSDIAKIWLFYKKTFLCFMFFLVFCFPTASMW